MMGESACESNGTILLPFLKAEAYEFEAGPMLDRGATCQGLRSGSLQVMDDQT